MTVDIAPEYMIGRLFLYNPTNIVTINNGERYRAFIIKTIEDHDKKIARDLAITKSVHSFNDNRYQEINAYTTIIRNIEKDHDDPDVWKFKRITAHEYPILPHRHNYKGSR